MRHLPGITSYILRVFFSTCNVIRGQDKPVQLKQ